MRSEEFVNAVKFIKIVKFIGKSEKTMILLLCWKLENNRLLFLFYTIQQIGKEWGDIFQSVIFMYARAFPKQLI